MTELTEKDRARYHRQMIIPGWGDEGQLRLKRTKIGVLGAGGLGCSILMQLAAAGFGKIILADKDTVELGNLNRQPLHWQRDIGRSKAKSAFEKLGELNPEVEIVCHDGEVDSRNIGEVFQEVDGLMDGLDNFRDRYIVNEFAVERRIPFFHGAVWGLEGRAATIIPGKTPCFRCIYPQSPPREIPPVLGATPVLIASIQVTEAVKHFAGIGEVLAGEVLFYDGMSMSFLKAKVERDPDCPVCGRVSP
jgi:adenylyltransferase/sulfurtransferase